MSADVDNRDFFFEKPNLFDCQSDFGVLENRIEDSLMLGFAYGATLDVHAIDNHVIGVLALVVFGFYTSLAGQPLFRSSLFSDNA